MKATKFAKRILSFVIVMAILAAALVPVSAATPADVGFTLAWPAANAWTQGTPPAWANVDDDPDDDQDVASRTIQAIYDEYAYQRDVVGFNMGTMNAGVTAWGDMVNVQFENGDHTGCPWANQPNRRMGGIISPFPGTAFSVKADTAKSYGVIPLGNETTWTNPTDGKYKIQMMTGNQFVAKKAEGTYPAPTAWAGFAGQGAANVNAFQKAYAEAAAGIISGERVNLGYVAEAVQTVNGIQYQEFRGDENTGTYGMFTADGETSGGIALIASVSGAEEAYVIADDMFNAWKTTWNVDLTTLTNSLTGVDMFGVTGAPTSNAYKVGDVTYQDFEKGVMMIDKDGKVSGPIDNNTKFTVDFDYEEMIVEGNDYYYLVADEVDPTDIDLGIAAESETSTVVTDPENAKDFTTPVTVTVTAASGRSESYTITVLSNVNASTEDTLAVRKVEMMLDQIPATIYRNDLPLIAAIEDAYKKLTPAQRFLVNLDKLDALADRIAEIKADPIIVSCVGDSITAGIGASGGAFNYPSQLKAMLGESYSVGNYGVSGSNVMTDRDVVISYNKTGEYANSIASNPDIVIIALGTNDAGNGGWNDTAPAQFEKDFKALVEEYRNLPSKPFVWVTLPFACWDAPAGVAPADRQHSGRHNNNVTGTIPIIKSVCAELMAEDSMIDIIDMFNFSIDHPEWFGDGLHPNDAGYEIIAAEFKKYVLEAVDVVADVSIDAIKIDREPMADFDEATKNYKVEVDSLDQLPKIEVDYTKSENKTVTVTQATKENPTATVAATSTIGASGAVYSITFYVPSEDDPAVKKVEALIDAISDEELTLDDEATVELANITYKALSAGQKGKVDADKVTKLNAAVAEIKALNDQAAADAVADMVEAIGEVTLESEADIAAARAAYDALTDEQKALATAVDALAAIEAAQLKYNGLKGDADAAAAAAVVALIEKLPAADKVAETDKEAVDAAQAAFENLTAEQVALISDEFQAKLEAVVAALEDLLSPYDKYEAEDGFCIDYAKVVSDTAAALSSGKQFVGDLGGDATVTANGFVEITVVSEHAADVELIVAYNGAAQRTYEISVNGIAIPALVCESTGTWGGVAVEKSAGVISLKAGENKIRLGNSTDWAPNLDYILVSELTDEMIEDAANAVAQVIKDLRPAEDITLLDKADVDAAALAYATLSDAQKEMIAEEGAKLEAAQAKIAELEAAQPTVVKGDLTGEGKVTVSDILALKNIIMSGKAPTADQLAAADTNNDSKLTVADILGVKAIIMG